MSRAATARRPTPTALLEAQVRYAATDLWRGRVVLIFSLALPLVWLLVIGALAGNATLDDGSGVRVMQFVTPSAAAMGVLYGTYPTVAISLAEARESGVLKRFRGTPLPAWTYLAGRIGGAVLYALAAVVVTVAVGVTAFDVQIVWRTLPATLVTLVVGIACFAAVGLAVAAVAPRPSFAQVASVGSAVALTFVSGMFTFGGATPAWMDTVAGIFPLKPFTEALQDQFNPFHSGAGWDPGALAVDVAWGVAAAAVAARSFGWEPRSLAAAPRPPVEARSGTGTPAAAVVSTSSPRPAALVLDQARAANRSTWRDGGSVFFALLMPVGLYAFMVVTQGSDLVLDGVPFPVVFGASMVVWGASVTVFMNVPEAVVSARDRGVLKRLRGTPLRPAQYLAGRTAAGLFLALVITAAIVALGEVFFGVDLSLGGLLLGLAVLVVGTLTMAACGFALAAMVPNSRAVGAVGLIVLLVLAFFSDVFVNDAPDWMQTVGSFFPLLHFQNALAQAWHPGGASVGWGHLAVLVAWGVAAGATAVRFFRWEPTAGQ